MRKYILICCCILLAGCGQKSVSPRDFLAYVDDPSNHLIVKEEIGSFVISAQYRPAAYETIKAAGADNKASLEKELQQEDSVQYIVLRLEAKDGHSDVLGMGIFSQDEYEQRIQYLSAAVPMDLVLIDGPDTLSCIAHHWERSYHITHFNNILLAFDNKHPGLKNNKTLVFNDHVFGLGKVQLQFKQHDISSIPTITL